MLDPATRLIEAKGELVRAFCSALEFGVSLPECLALLGVEGKAATMIRAFLSRYNEAQIAEMLRAMVDEQESPERGRKETTQIPITEA